MKRQICTPHFKYIGGDLSLYPLYRESGGVYIDENNQSILDLFHFCADNGFNTIRCYLLVNPSNDYLDCQNLDYVLKFAKEIKSQGFYFYLSIHCSDKHADSTRQDKPLKWSDLSLDELQNEIYIYTKKIFM